MPFLNREPHRLGHQIKRKTCPECDGEGVIERESGPVGSPTWRWKLTDFECPVCEGAGKIICEEEEE